MGRRDYTPIRGFYLCTSWILPKQSASYTEKHCKNKTQVFLYITVSMAMFAEILSVYARSMDFFTTSPQTHQCQSRNFHDRTRYKLDFLAQCWTVFLSTASDHTQMSWKEWSCSQHQCSLCSEQTSEHHTDEREGYSVVLQHADHHKVPACRQSKQMFTSASLANLLNSQPRGGFTVNMKQWGDSWPVTSVWLAITVASHAVTLLVTALTSIEAGRRHLWKCWRRKRKGSPRGGTMQC